MQNKIYEKPAPGEAIADALDEMWHYIGSKANKIWIWKAYQGETDKLIDWEIGKRDAATFSRLADRLSKCNVELYCCDGWAVYPEVLGEDNLIQSKSQTHYIEGNNGRQRHWHSRFRRRAIVVSKTIEMVDLTIALFAKYHVNGGGKVAPSLLT